MKVIPFLVAAVVFCGCGAVAGPAESVIMPPYPDISGWQKITNAANADQLYYEWIPQGQAIGNFHDILVEQAFYKLKGLSPVSFANALLARLQRACSKTSRNGPIERTEHGFTVAYAQNYCVDSQGKHEDVDGFIKIIGGRDGIYVFQREFHYPTANGVPGTHVYPAGHGDEARADIAAHAAAAAYLDAVQLCPTADDSPCPSTTGSGAVPR
jgi:hypothetical protein